MTILDQFMTALLLKNKTLIQWPIQKKKFSGLYLLSLCLLVSLLSIFWLLSSLNAPLIVQRLDTTEFYISHDKLVVPSNPDIKEINLTDNFKLKKEALDYNSIQLSYKQLQAFFPNKELTSQFLAQQLTTNKQQLMFFLLIFAYLNALPFIGLTLGMSFILAKLAYHLLARKFEVTFAQSYMYTCYAFTTPLCLFLVYNLATHHFLTRLWLLFLFTAVNIFSIIWLKNKELTPLT